MYSSKKILLFLSIIRARAGARALGHLAIIALSLFTFTDSAFAAIAVGPHCDQETLQGAINAVQGANTEIQVLSTYTSGPVSIKDKVVQIKGGYTLDPSDNKCAFPMPPINNATSSTIDGAGTTGPLISISGDSKVELDNLIISNAHNDNGNGGGISFTSGGTMASLDLYATTVYSNNAARGGGIYFDGEASTDNLTLHDGSLVELNTAQFAGGGIAIEGNTYLLMTRPNTLISGNNASGGDGGGLYMSNTTHADIGSVGQNTKAVIYNNQVAHFGGGIYATDQANLRMYTTSPGVLTRVENNSALYGGGIALESNGDNHPQLCGYGAGINNNTATAEGSAISLIGDSRVNNYVTGNFDDQCIDSLGQAPPDEVGCPQGQPCNTFDGNTATDSDVGDTVYLASAIFKADRIRLQGNKALSEITAQGGPSASPSTIKNCLIAQNNVVSGTGAIFYLDSPFIIDSCTIANNTGHINGVFSSRGDFAGSPFMTLQNSLVSQSGSATFANDFDPSKIAVANTIAGDAKNCVGGTFNFCSNFQAKAPAFVNTAANDYHLTTASPLDYFAACSGTDLEGRPRGVAYFVGTATPCDPGAYEYQDAFPPNENFDGVDPQSLQLPFGWTATTVGNAPGFSISASTFFSPPYSAFAPAPDNAQSDSRLITPAFPIVKAARVTFKQAFILETSFDGAILEMSVNNGPFKEITRAGAAIIQGNYTSQLMPGATRNPIEEQYPRTFAWTGSSGGFEDVTVELPASVDGQNIQLSWRVGTDGNCCAGGYGYWLDDIHIDNDLPSTDLIFKNGMD